MAELDFQDAPSKKPSIPVPPTGKGHDRLRRPRSIGFWPRIVVVLSAVTLPQLLIAQDPRAKEDLETAIAAEKEGQYQRAVEVYERLLGEAGTSPQSSALVIQVRTRLATGYFLLHRYEESLRTVTPLTRPNHPRGEIPAQAWLVEGLDNLQLNDPTKALSSLRRALALNPSSGTARLALGDSLAQTGRFREAVRVYEEQTRNTPKEPEAWYKLGLAYSELATEDSTILSRKIPGSVLGDELRAGRLIDTGDELASAGILIRLAGHASTDPNVHAELGSVLLDLGYPGAAENEFTQELSVDSDCPLAHLGIAETAALENNWEQAIRGLKALARTHPHELSRLIELPPAGLLRQSWHDGKVQVPEAYRNSPVGMLWQAWLSNSEIPAIANVAERDPACTGPTPKGAGTPGFWLTETCYKGLRIRLRGMRTLTVKQRVKLAEAEFRLGDYKKAREQSIRLLSIDSGNAWGMYWRSQSEEELADECFSKVTTLNPESARVHQMVAEYFASRHHFPRAASEYESAIRLAPDLPELHLGLGSVYRQMEEWQNAERELNQTLELTPGSAMAHFALGDTYVREHRWQMAIDHLKIALANPAIAMSVRLDLATAEGELGETHEAVDDLIAVAAQDRDGELHYRLGELYRKLGDKEHSQEAFAIFKRLRDASMQVDRSELKALEEMSVAKKDDSHR